MTRYFTKNTALIAWTRCTQKDAAFLIAQGWTEIDRDAHRDLARKLKETTP